MKTLILQYNAGLITLTELQRAVDLLNMGSDTHFYRFRIAGGLAISF